MRTHDLKEFEHTKEIGNHFKPNIWPKLAIFKYSCSCLYSNTKNSYFKLIDADLQQNLNVLQEWDEGRSSVKWEL